MIDNRVVASTGAAAGIGDYFAKERANGRYWLTDPSFAGSCVANDPSKAAANSAAWDALYAAIGPQGATVCVPIAAGGPFYFARQWLIAKRSVGLVGLSSGWRSGEYSDKVQTGSHLRFQLSTGRCVEYNFNPNLQENYDGYLTGVLVEDLLITSTGGRDSAVVGLYVGTSDHAKINRVAALDCGLAVHLDKCDSPTLDACQVCENGNGILVEAGFYARVLNTISADQEGKTATGPNSAFGVSLLNTRGAIVTGNIFARNKVSLWVKNSTYCVLGGNSYAETIGPAVRLENSSNCTLHGGSASDTKDYAVQLLGSTRNTIQGLAAQTGTTIPNVYLDAASTHNQVLDCLVSIGYLDNNTSGPNGASTNVIRDNFAASVGTGTGGGGTGGGSTTASAPSTGRNTGSIQYIDISASDASVTKGGAGWTTGVDGTVYNNSNYNSTAGTFAANNHDQYLELAATNVTGFLYNGGSGSLACDDVYVTITAASGVVAQSFHFSQYAAQDQAAHTLFNSVTAAGGGALPTGNYTIRFTRYGAATIACNTITLVRRY